MQDNQQPVLETPEPWTAFCHTAQEQSSRQLRHVSGHAQGHGRSPRHCQR